MMEKKPDTNRDAELAAFFKAAKDVEVPPNAAFMEAIIKDAVNQTNARAPIPQPPSRLQHAWALFFRNIGGWPSVTALAASAFLGITAGYAAPNAFDYFDDTRTTVETYSDDNFSVASDIEALFGEG